jgi:flagellar basal-body rod protein FlgB
MEIRGTLGDRAGLGPLKRALDAYALRHRVIAANIANAEVQGYNPKRVEFEKYAQRAIEKTMNVHMARTDPKHMSAEESLDFIEPEVTQESVPGGENPGVDVEKEIVGMVKNQLSYRLAVRLLDMKYSQLHSAITGNRR